MTGFRDLIVTKQKSTGDVYMSAVSGGKRTNEPVGSGCVFFEFLLDKVFSTPVNLINLASCLVMSI